MSSISTIPLWGQAYELTVTYATATGEPQYATLTSSAWEPEALRMTFEVEQNFTQDPFWYADITVYNLNSQEAQNALANATWVTLKAGFQYGPSKYGTIWDGPILQVLYDRQNVVDQRITFHCQANPLLLDQIVNVPMGQGTSQLQLVQRMVQQTNAPPMGVNYGNVSQKASDLLSVNRYPRGRGVFGKVGKFIAQLADSNFMQSFTDGYKAYISEVDNGKRTPDLLYAPLPPPDTPVTISPGVAVTQSIIGTPQQTLQGCNFSVLLDPRLVIKMPPLLVRLERTIINQVAIRIPGLPPSPLSADLTFFVSQVRHFGDTRGNDWQTDVVGFTTTYAQNLPFGLYTPNSAGGGA